jgi:hypothetical protein
VQSHIYRLLDLPAATQHNMAQHSKLMLGRLEAGAAPGARAFMQPTCQRCWMHQTSDPLSAADLQPTPHPPSCVMQTPCPCPAMPHGTPDPLHPPECCRPCVNLLLAFCSAHPHAPPPLVVCLVCACCCLAGCWCGLSRRHGRILVVLLGAAAAAAAARAWACYSLGVLVAVGMS